MHSFGVNPKLTTMKFGVNKPETSLYSMMQIVFHYLKCLPDRRQIAVSNSMVRHNCRHAINLSLIYVASVMFDKLCVSVISGGKR